MTTILTIILLLAVAAIPVGVHLGFRAPRRRETGSPADFGLAYERVTIPTLRGRHLFGWLLPAPAATRTLVILHGWGGNAEQMLPMAAPFVRAGFNVLLFDARNHGKSDGDTFSSLPRFAEDLGMAISWLHREHRERATCVAVLGHSVGAGAALFEASRNPHIAALISIAAFAHPSQVTEDAVRRLRLPRVVTMLIIRYVEWLIGHRFDTIAPVNTIARIPCPVLLVHGDADRVVPIHDAYHIIARANRPDHRLLEIADADHDSVERIEQHVGDLLGFLDGHCAASARS
ncbi:alpha/beta hydrolase [Thiocapsa imhoffii]|uniref:Alpha/beta hydrolase n=1 Tax=Thiocapsa imhoffii TaxID=382777 RepID=A0A9X0WG45_9GAMM|nr:alpha/beta fold hydrolase [Thiocapsa imhoffii]MBK1643988.1 alpha/beta hydrolase [Thiocapsa imhoffii]